MVFGILELLNRLDQLSLIRGISTRIFEHRRPESSNSISSGLLALEECGLHYDFGLFSWGVLKEEGSE
jgi:hypothetical protein